MNLRFVAGSTGFTSQVKAALHINGLYTNLYLNLHI